MSVDHTPNAAPAAPQLSLVKDTPAASAAPLEGRVIPFPEWEIGEDPEGDRPWINPALKTRQGRAARRAYRRRQLRRRVRKAAARQRTAHGVLPRMVRGERQVRLWIRGVEGHKAKADLALAQAMTREADRTARRARFALLDGKAKRALAQHAQQEASKAVVVAMAAREKARGKVRLRAAAVYGTTFAVDSIALGVEGLLGLLVAGMVELGILAWLGRDVELSEEQLAALERVEAGAPQLVEPGMTPRAFEQMFREALVDDLRVGFSSLRLEVPAWGFEVHVWLDRQTPEKISAQLDLLEACLPGVRTGSVMLRQSMQSRNYCVIAVPGRDAWQAVPELPYRAPKSITTKEAHTAQIGAAMSGQPLALPVCRTNINMVAKARAGKSTLLRDLVDVLTATSDQIVIGIDLGSAGSGFGAYRRCMHAVATSPEDAHDVLQWALDLGKGRPDLFDDFGMGQNWQTSPQRPGIKVIVDEFPALVRESRKGYPAEDGKRMPWDLDGMLAELVITSAKSDVTVALAGQGVTKEKIKENTWVTELPVQVLGACDVDDILQTLGGGVMAQGWRPDRLIPAMGDEINDAGVVYVLAGADYCEPLPYRACTASDEEQERRAVERLAAGLVGIDAESAKLSRITLAQIMEIGKRTSRRHETSPSLLTTIRWVFTNVGDPTGLSREELADALGGADPDRWALDRFDGDVATRVEAVQQAINAVLAPTGRSWTTDSYRPKGSPTTAKGYCLRHLKKITGEGSEGP